MSLINAQWVNGQTAYSCKRAVRCETVWVTKTAIVAGIRGRESWRTDACFMGPTDNVGELDRAWCMQIPTCLSDLMGPSPPS